jgi:branched-chain amino acid transport system permease protein
MEYFAHILVLACYYTLLSVSLNLVVGYAGLPALGHIGFACVGAYSSALLSVNLGLSPWLGLPVAAGLAALSGAAIGIPSLRLEGDYFALATLGFGIIIYAIAKNWTGLTRGSMGIPGIPAYSVAGKPLQSPWSTLALYFPIAASGVFLINTITRSPFGLVLTGLREDEEATQALGKDTTSAKLKAFVVGASLAGVAGAMYAHYFTYIDPSSFSVMESLLVLFMIIFGGLGTIRGSIAGAILLVLFPELLRYLGVPSSIAGPLRQVVYGTGLVLLMLFRPQGLLGSYKFD